MRLQVVLNLLDTLSGGKTEAKTNMVGRGGRLGGRCGGRTNTRANTVSITSGSSNNETSSLLFTVEQWKTLTSLMDNAKITDQRLNGEFYKRLWIIDSGATHHVKGDVSWLREVERIPGRLVGLPNGKKVIRTHKGLVRLSDNIMLKNDLLVPKLNCNHISMSQLNDDMKCVASFDSHICAIQDRSRRLIGTGVRRDGLYYFKKGEPILHVWVNGVVSTMELWHKRMGPPSEKIVKLLSPVVIVRVV